MNYRQKTSAKAWSTFRKNFDMKKVDLENVGRNKKFAEKSNFLRKNQNFSHKINFLYSNIYYKYI